MTGEHRSYSRGVCHFDPTATEHLREVDARSRHDLAMCWSAPSESKRGPRQRRSALGDLAQLGADDRERASCKSAQAHSEGAATRDRIVAVAAQLMFEHGRGSTSLADVQEGPEL